MLRWLRPAEPADLSLFASHFASQSFPEELRRAFPGALAWHGGSFWLRKR